LRQDRSIEARDH